MKKKISLMLAAALTAGLQEGRCFRILEASRYWISKDWGIARIKIFIGKIFPK